MQAGDPAQRLLILVEDDAAVLGSLSFALETEGFTVASFGSAEALMRSSISIVDACLIVDQMLPGVSGLDLLEQLRTKNPTQKAILLVSLITPQIELRAKRNGLTIVEKPLLGGALVKAIRAA